MQPAAAFLPMSTSYSWLVYERLFLEEAGAVVVVVVGTAEVRDDSRDDDDDDDVDDIPSSEAVA